MFQGVKMSVKFIHDLFVASVLLVLAAATVFGNDGPSKKKFRKQQPVKIEIRPIGPSQGVLDAAKARMLNSSVVQNELVGRKFYVISFEAVDNGTSDPVEFRSVVCDHSGNRTLIITGDLAGKLPVTFHETTEQPVPSDDEFNDAVAIIKNDPAFAADIKGNVLKAFRPMPDVTILTGTVERLVNVGLDGRGTGRNEVVSVSIRNGNVIRYKENAPPSAVATPEACGIASAGEATTSSGTAGQYQMSVTQGGNPLWDILILRPSISSGSSKRSAIEVRDVKYKGKSVLKRGHTPILNVQYVGGQCGPYRDWQYQEGNFQTPGSGNTDPAAGIRLMASGNIPTTALESGADSGNFRGVAVYTQNNETVLVTELEAGWYRYISEWRFANDGTIRPRFGFGATDNSCVCFAHNHHVYWRLDFDVVNTNNRVYQVERGRKFGRPIATEAFMNKNIQTNKSLLIQNSTGNEAYELVPSVTDGVVDAFGVHDMWVLAFKGTPTAPTELEDGITCVTCSTAYIQIDPFVNSESVVDQDVVVWYGAHFLHDDGGNFTGISRRPDVLSGSHVVGPDLRPVRW